MILDRSQNHVAPTGTRNLRFYSRILNDLLRGRPRRFGAKTKEQFAIARRTSVHSQRKSHHRTATAHRKIYLCKRISHALAHNSIKRGAEQCLSSCSRRAAANVLGEVQLWLLFSILSSGAGQLMKVDAKEHRGTAGTLPYQDLRARPMST